jgi:hypothetical protein
MFVKTDKANRIVQYPYTLDMFRNENRNKSLPKFLNNRFLARNHVYPVREDTKPEYTEATQYLVRDDQPTYENETWTVGWTVKDKTPEQIEADTDMKASQIRTERDERLAETDWVTIRATDTGEPVDPLWAAYRQSLRDITSQEGFPWTVTWPEKP